MNHESMQDVYRRFKKHENLRKMLTYFQSKNYIDQKIYSSALDILSMYEDSRAEMTQFQKKLYDILILRADASSYEDFNVDNFQKEWRRLQKKNPNGQSSNPPERLSNSIGMEFVRIKSGEVMDKETQKKIKIPKDFYLQTTPVTVDQWKKFADGWHYKTAAEENAGAYVWEWHKNEWKQIQKKGIHWANPGFKQNGNHPVTCISFIDAKAFIDWLIHKEKKTYRLPNEAEWEYACRAGTPTPFCFGYSLKDRANFGPRERFSGLDDKNEIHRERTTPVKKFEPNDWGLYDMHGNVWEWCEDSGTVSGNRIIRGGSWLFDDKACKSAKRDEQEENQGNFNIGFRLAMEI
ncbi:MAG: formylglycine-generating enzyme family protein [Desulfobacterales bacterium]